MPWPPTWSQISGIVERLITIALATAFSYAVLKGWISKEDAVKWGADLAPLILAAASAWYGYRINRPKAIAQAAAALPDTTVVTSPAIARSTPERNIVSAATNTVEPIPIGDTKTTEDLNREEFARHGG